MTKPNKVISQPLYQRLGLTTMHSIQPASTGVWLGPLPRAYSEGEFCVPRLAINGPVTWESISF